jgi:hypothetical protein
MPLFPVSAANVHVPDVLQPSVFSQSSREVTSQWSFRKVQKPFFLQSSPFAQSLGPKVPHFPSSAVHLLKRWHTSELLQSSPLATQIPSVALQSPSSLQPSVGAQCAFEVGAQIPFRSPQAPEAGHPANLGQLPAVPRQSLPTSSQRPASSQAFERLQSSGSVATQPPPLAVQSPLSRHSSLHLSALCSWQPKLALVKSATKNERRRPVLIPLHSYPEPSR